MDGMYAVRYTDTEGVESYHLLLDVDELTDYVSETATLSDASQFLIDVASPEFIVQVYLEAVTE